MDRAVLCVKGRGRGLQPALLPGGPVEGCRLLRLAEDLHEPLHLQAALLAHAVIPLMLLMLVGILGLNDSPVSRGVVIVSLLFHDTGPSRAVG